MLEIEIGKVRCKTALKSQSRVNVGCSLICGRWL